MFRIYYTKNVQKGLIQTTYSTTKTASVHGIALTFNFPQSHFQVLDFSFRDAFLGFQFLSLWCIFVHHLETVIQHIHM